MRILRSSHPEHSGYEDADFCSSARSGEKHVNLLLEAITPATKTTQLLQAGWIITWN